MTEVITEENFENIPFEEQAKYGHVRSFFLTVMMVIRTPSLFFRKMHVNKGLGHPFIFIIIILSVSNIMNYIYIKNGIIDSPADQLISTMEKEPELKQQADNLRSMFSKEPTLLDVPVSIFANFTFLYLVAAFWHLILRSVKAAGNGFEATVRVMCYSTAVLLTSIIPVNNTYVNLATYTWWAILISKGIAEAHEVSSNLAWRGMMIALFTTLVLFIMLVSAVF